MKNRLAILGLLLFLMSDCLSQTDSDRHSTNLIIVINEEVVIGSITRVRLVREFEELELGYYPGNLFMDMNDYGSIDKNDSTTMFLVFEHYFDEEKSQETKKYEIPVTPAMLDYGFMVLKIYDLGKRKYRKLFEPLPNKNYTFEINSSEFQMNRVRKKR